MDGSASELIAIEQLARRFAGSELAKTTLADDAYPFAPWNARAFQSAAELGFVGMSLPEAYGGSAQGTGAFARLLEIIAAIDASQAAVLLTQALARATLIALDGGELAQRFATLQGRGDEPLIAYALYDDPDEPAFTVRARRRGDGYVLDGELAQLACAPVASALVVAAALSDGAQGESLAFFLVEPTQPGVSIGAPLPTLGLHACPLADVELRDVQLPASARLGGADAAAVYARTAERFRPALVAISLGVLRGSFELAYEYAKQRKQGKKLIVQHHMVQEMLADMLSVLDVGTLALRRACEACDSGEVSTTELVALHELITKLVTRATTDGVQLLGGNGYMHDYGQEKRMRDAKQLQAVFGSEATRRLRVLERKLASEGSR